MTHLYACLGGFAVCAVAARLIARANEREPGDDRLISLTEVVSYLRDESAYGREKVHISDQDLRFMLIDAFAHGFVKAFARPRTTWASSTPIAGVRTKTLLRWLGSPLSISTDVVINLDAIRNDGPRQITLKPGHFGNEFHHWQFLLSDVRKLWPPFKEPKVKRGRK